MQCRHTTCAVCCSNCCSFILTISRFLRCLHLCITMYRVLLTARATVLQSYSKHLNSKHSIFHFPTCSLYTSQSTCMHDTVTFIFFLLSNICFIYVHVHAIRVYKHLSFFRPTHIQT